MTDPPTTPPADAESYTKCWERHQRQPIIPSELMFPTDLLIRSILGMNLSIEGGATRINNTINNLYSSQ